MEKKPYERKNQLIIKIHEQANIKYFKDPKSFTEYSRDKKNVYANTDGYNPNKKC